MRRSALLILISFFVMSGSADAQGFRLARATKRAAKKVSTTAAGSLVDCFRSKLMAFECGLLVAATVYDAKETVSCSNVSLNCSVDNQAGSSRPGLFQIISAYAVEDMSLLVGADAARQSSALGSVAVILPTAALHLDSALQNQKIVADLKRQGVIDK